MKHYYSQNVIDFVNDYSFVGLNLNLTCLMIYLEILKNVALLKISIS